MFVGFLLSGLALPLELPWLFFVGLGVVALGAVVGKVMQMMGIGNTVTYKDEPRPGVRPQHDAGLVRARRHRHAQHGSRPPTSRGITQ